MNSPNINQYIKNLTDTTGFFYYSIYNALKLRFPPSEFKSTVKYYKKYTDKWIINIDVPSILNISDEYVDECISNFKKVKTFKPLNI